MGLINRIEACNRLHFCNDQILKMCSRALSLAGKVASLDQLSILFDGGGDSDLIAFAQIPT
jgi:hypothetical protein